MMRKSKKIRQVCRLLELTLVSVCLMGCSSKGEDINAGMQAIEELQYEEALADFEKALVSGEDTELIYRGQGIAYLGLMQYDEAADAFIKALGNAANVTSLEYDINYYLATAYTKNNKLEEAMEVYSSILALRPSETDAWFYRGRLRLLKGSLDAATADFDQAVLTAPKNYPLYVQISECLTSAGQQELADGYLNRALEQNDKSMGDFDKGCLYYYLRDYQNARDCLERAEDKQTNADVVLFLGKTYEALGDYNYAASVYANYLANDGAQPELQNQLGVCYLGMGEYQSALSAFEAGLAVTENNDCVQNLKFNEIVAMEYLGDFQKASGAMQAYLKNYPDDEAAVRENQFLKTR